MKIAKPLLLVSTPLGVAGGLYEAIRLTGGLAFIMLAFILMMSAAMAIVVATIRRESRAERAKSAAVVTASASVASLDNNHSSRLV